VITKRYSISENFYTDEKTIGEYLHGNGICYKIQTITRHKGPDKGTVRLIYTTSLCNEDALVLKLTYSEIEIKEAI